MIKQSKGKKMEVIISNKITIKNPSWDITSFCLRELVIDNPDYQNMLKRGKPEAVRFSKIPPKLYLYVAKGGDLVLPFGCVYAIWKYIKDCPIKTEFNNAGELSCKADKITQPLYDYQEKAVQAMLDAKGGVLVGGTGSGKTNVAIELAHRIGRKFLWLTHTYDLVKQTYGRIRSLYPNMKVEITSDGKVNFGQDATVATVQTMAKLDPSVYANEFDVVITDECHHVCNSPTLSKLFGKVVSAIPARYKFGVTATPKRNDSLTKTIYTTLGCNKLGEFGPVYKIEKSETKTITAIHEKVALETPFSYCFLDESGVFNYPALVDYIANNEERNKAIVQNIIEHSYNKQLVLCSRISQCETIHQMLVDKGYNAQLLIGKVTAKKRDAILAQKDEPCIIVGSVSLAREGLDIPFLDTLHLCSCIGNENDTIQCVGRIERAYPGKEKAVVYDYVDVKIPYLVSRYNKRVKWLKNKNK